MRPSVTIIGIGSRKGRTGGRSRRVRPLGYEDYTIVKNSTFNGVRLPSIVTYEPDTQELRVARRFGYEDYRNRQW